MARARVNKKAPAKKAAAKKAPAKKEAAKKATKPGKPTGQSKTLGADVDPADVAGPPLTVAELPDGADVPGTPRAKAGPPAAASAAPVAGTRPPTVTRNGFVRLTRAGAIESQPVYVNVQNIVLVESTLPLPGLATPPEAGATVHLMGQPTWPLFVKESVEVVVSALAQAPTQS